MSTEKAQINHHNTEKISEGGKMNQAICPHCEKPNPMGKMWKFGEINPKTEQAIIFCGDDEEMNGGCGKRILVEWTWVPEIMVSAIGERIR